MAAYPELTLSPPSYSRIFVLLTLTLTFHAAFCVLPPLSRNPNFASEIVLVGDAGVVYGSTQESFVRLNGGLILHPKPFKFLPRSPASVASFSVGFSFSISPTNGAGFLMVIAPSNFFSKFPGKSAFEVRDETRFFGVEFDTLLDENVNDVNANHVGIDVSTLVSARVFNVSEIGIVLSSGAKLRCWIDYFASLKKLNVRLSKSPEPKPINPSLKYSIDLGEMWKEEEVVLGLVSINGSSAQTVSVYSWSADIEGVPKWLHSQPVNPKDFAGEPKTGDLIGFCFLNKLAFATGCVALAALTLLFLRQLLSDKFRDVEGDRSVGSVCLRYEKIDNRGREI